MGSRSTSGRLQDIALRLQDTQSLFVVVNVGANLLFLARSYVTMQALDYTALGLVALLQSVMLLVGTLQFGILNGAYRLLCDASDAERGQINNLVYSFIAILSVAALAVAFVMEQRAGGPGVALIAFLGAVGGIATLLRTWITNQMIALGLLAALNRATLWAALLSMAPLLLVPMAPFEACVASVVLQPLLFAAMTLNGRPALRPSGLSFDRPLLRRVLVSGFVVFLTGIFLQLNLQIERWYVVAMLGVDALGHLYLAILFVTLFQLVPNAFDAIFLPKLVRARGSAEPREAARAIRRFFLLQLGYSAVAAAAVLILAAPVLRLILPQYLPDLRYVVLLLPGLIAFTLTAPFAIVFNVLIQYRFYLFAYGGGTLLTALIFGVTALAGQRFDLDKVTLVRSAIYGFMAIVLLIGFAVVTRANREFRFGWRQRGLA